MKNALILEGGGMRGAFTSGVLDYFNEHNIIFDSVIGVSAGALNATRYLANQPKLSINIMLENLKNKEYCSFESLLKTGNIFGVDLLYDKIPKVLYPLDNEYFKNSGVIFRVCMTNCKTGKAEYPIINDMFLDIDYIKASSSLPLVSKMVNINNNYYLDGGISDSIPVKESIRLGYNKNVVILTQPLDYVKKPTKTLSLIKSRYKQFPGLIKDVEVRHEMYNDTLKFINNNKSIFVIRPDSSLNIGRIEKNQQKLMDAYNKGYLKAKSMHKDLLEYLKRK
ncbi:MAG: patatin family protein [Bacilli bacterium]